MDKEIKITRNESKKIMDGIKQTKVGRELMQLDSMISVFTQGMGGIQPLKSAFHPHSMSTQDPITLSYGPAIIERVHDKGENGWKNQRYLGQRVIITKIETFEIFGAMYTCKYDGDPALDGEYVNNTMFTDYHLTQNSDHYHDFYDEKEAKDYIENLQSEDDRYFAQGTNQEDNDGKEFWRVMVWKEEKE